jgi:hypothetical protein
MMVDALQGLLQGLFGSVFPLVWTVLKIVLIIAPLLLAVAYLTFWERKVIGWMQVRIGPNRVGPWGLIQPIADGLKLLLKEVVIPTGSDKSVFLLAPMFAFAPALAAWAVIPFNDTLVLANVNASLLYIMSITSIGVYGIILSGWASNSKYAFLGGMRSAAQMISYEVAMGLALVVVLMVSNSLNLGDIVNGQGRGYFAEHGTRIPVVELVAAAADVRRLSGGDRRRDQPRAIRSGGRRIGDRRLPRRVFGNGFCGVLPGRIRQHDPGVDADLDPVPRRLAVAGGLPARWHPVAVPEDFRRAVRLPLDSRHLPSLSLRPDHASRLESVHPAVPDLAGRRRRLDDVALNIWK